MIRGPARSERSRGGRAGTAIASICAHSALARGWPVPQRIRTFSRVRCCSMSDWTALLSHALDAVNPRLADDQRTDSAASALALDPVLAGAVFASIATS